MGRRGRIVIGILAGIAVLAVVLGVVVLPRIDLAGVAAARATAALGRGVTIESLRITPGLPTRIALRGLRIANIEGGTRADMVELARLDVAVAPLPLLTGQVAVNEISAAGFILFLERAPGRRPNWRFGEAREGGGAARLVLPALLELADSQVVFRTTSGAELVTRIDSARLAASPAERPGSIEARGSYNGVPLRLEGALFSADQFRAGGPLPLTLRATAEHTSLLFEGTGTDPLNADGLDGRLTLAATTPTDILAMAGAGAGPDVPVELSGHFTRQGDLWRLSEATGRLDGAALAAALLELTEGSAGQPDRIVGRIEVARLDVNSLLGPDEGARGHGDADIPPVVSALPDPLLDVEASTRELIYARLRGSDARARLEVAPGRITLHEAAVTAFGARLAGSAELLPAPRGARVAAQVTLRDGEIDTLRRAFGLHALPVSGRLSADIAAAAEAASVNAATRQARISAVVGMTGGTIAREAIEMASTDVRALFRTSRGTTPLRCLLAAVDIDAGVGRAAPLRIRAGTGTISGLATFDLNRQMLDLIIGSQSDTTDFFALDIPVQVRGSFADPSIAPAEWSRAARERMAHNEMAPLPPELRAIAQRNACYSGRSLRR
ncbi:AsmA family protein [Roseomonas rosulenta]|uniref:AsmA family protein n=1 Tax=Roseomonas rosulenta TaxID=2748667 RepID=UPI0018DF9256|nr:AsmA family protein [Roseomonas rosulenta]